MFFYFYIVQTIYLLLLREEASRRFCAIGCESFSLVITGFWMIFINKRMYFYRRRPSCLRFCGGFSFRLLWFQVQRFSKCSVKGVRVLPLPSEKLFLSALGSSVSVCSVPPWRANPAGVEGLVVMATG